MTSFPKRSIFLRAVDETNFTLERHCWLFAVLFALVLLGVSIAKDLRTKMWNDEFYTLRMAQQASSSEIIRATLESADSQPPLYAMVVHSILPWVRNDALAVRLPSTLGYCGMFLCLLAFCRRRLPVLYSLAAALLACQVCEPYATEGRSYGVILCCVAGALLCWQSAIDGNRRTLAIPLLAVCLALMIALHYYTLFFFVPLFLGEMARWRRSGKLDLPILAAMLPALLVLGLHYPLIAATKPLQAHYWSPAVWTAIPGWYFRYVFLELCVLPLCSLAMLSARLDRRSASRSSLTLPEWVAGGAFLLMPLCIVILALFTTHVFVDRYVLWAVPGIAVLATALLYATARGNILVVVSLLGMLVALIALREVHSFRARLVLSAEAEMVQRELASLQGGSEPVIVASNHVFMELSYYAPPRIRERLIYPASSGLDLRYFGHDTDSLTMTALSHNSKLHVVDLDALLRTYPRFVLAATPAHYLPRYLATAGYHVVPLGSAMPPVLYDVEGR